MKHIYLEFLTYKHITDVLSVSCTSPTTSVVDPSGMTWQAKLQGRLQIRVYLSIHRHHYFDWYVSFLKSGFDIQAKYEHELSLKKKPSGIPPANHREPIYWNHINKCQKRYAAGTASILSYPCHHAKCHSESITNDQPNCPSTELHLRLNCCILRHSRLDLTTVQGKLGWVYIYIEIDGIYL